MRRHLLAITAVGMTALLITMLSVTSLGASSSHQPAGDEPITLSGDVTPEVRRLAAVVVRASHDHGEETVTDELEIRFVDRVEAEGFLGGWTDGRLIVIGRNVALPERTLLHEFAHAVVGVEFGHGEPWRSVYITAFRDEFGDRKADRELRRIRWVYDKSYLDTVPPSRESSADSRLPNCLDVEIALARLPSLAASAVPTASASPRARNPRGRHPCPVDLHDP